jgi:intracellular septation protein A
MGSRKAAHLHLELNSTMSAYWELNSLVKDYKGKRALNGVTLSLNPNEVAGLFGVAFIGSQFIGKQPLIQRMLGSQLELPQVIWRNLNSAWALFFIALGFLNLYVVYHYDTDTWVDFKLFGLMGLTLSFMLLQGLYLARYIKEIPAKPDT